MVMQCTANSAGECHLDVVEVVGSNPTPCKRKSNFARGCFFRLSGNKGNKGKKAEKGKKSSKGKKGVKSAEDWPFRG